MLATRCVTQEDGFGKMNYGFYMFEYVSHKRNGFGKMNSGFYMFEWAESLQQGDVFFKETSYHWKIAKEFYKQTLSGWDSNNKPSCISFPYV